ncbi:MAG: hypothetical protein ACXWL5_01285 [Candidatus Chromulinivorax sp.]
MKNFKKNIIILLIILPISLHSFWFWQTAETKNDKLETLNRTIIEEPLSKEEEKLNEIKNMLFNAYLDCVKKNTKLQQNRDEKIGKAIEERNFWFEDNFNTESDSNPIVVFKEIFTQFMNNKSKKDTIDCNKYFDDYHKMGQLLFRLKLEKSNKAFKSEK